MMPAMSESAVTCSWEGRSRTYPIGSQCARSVEWKSGMPGKVEKLEQTR